jgi:hypothetical protein
MLRYLHFGRKVAGRRSARGAPSRVRVARIAPNRSHARRRAGPRPQRCHSCRTAHASRAICRVDHSATKMARALSPTTSGKCAFSPARRTSAKSGRFDPRQRTRRNSLLDQRNSQAIVEAMNARPIGGLRADGRDVQDQRDVLDAFEQTSPAWLEHRSPPHRPCGSLSHCGLVRSTWPCFSRHFGPGPRM